MTQRRNRPPIEVVGPDHESLTPRPPSGLMKATLARWDAFWRTEEATRLGAFDRAAVGRLFEYYDQHSRIWPVFTNEQFVDGPKGIEMNPAGRAALELEKTIDRLERRLALRSSTTATKTRQPVAPTDRPSG
jgi:hypothetical protein